VAPADQSAGPLSLRQMLFSFKGRIPRRSFWGFSLLMYGMYFLFLLGVSSINHEPAESLIGIVAHVLVLWTLLAISGKRWHDRDKSAWWSLVSLVPVAGPFFNFIECGFLRGTAGPNRFGADPVVSRAGVGASNRPDHAEPLRSSSF
jgi:uncharacterized membrane protein YhaH (DUF805 family)